MIKGVALAIEYTKNIRSAAASASTPPSVSALAAHGSISRFGSAVVLGRAKDKKQPLSSTEQRALVHRTNADEGAGGGAVWPWRVDAREESGCVRGEWMLEEE